MERLKDVERRATEALRVVLGHLSVITLKTIRRIPNGAGSRIGIVADINVLGHSQVLICQAEVDARREMLRATIKELQRSASEYTPSAIPVLIVPFLMPEVRSICEQDHCGFLDLEGNAGLAFGEVFIWERRLQVCRDVME